MKNEMVKAWMIGFAIIVAISLPPQIMWDHGSGGRFLAALWVIGCLIAAFVFFTKRAE